MSPGEEISGEGSIEKISLDKELDDATPENLNHRLESGERNIEEGSFIIEAAFEGNYVVVWIPSEHIPECLVGNDHPGQKWPAGGFVVELAQKLVDKLRDIREQTSIMAKKRTERLGHREDELTVW